MFPEVRREWSIHFPNVTLWTSPLIWTPSIDFYCAGALRRSALMLSDTNDVISFFIKTCNNSPTSQSARTQFRKWCNLVHWTYFLYESLDYRDHKYKKPLNMSKNLSIECNYFRTVRTRQPWSWPLCPAPPWWRWRSRGPTPNTSWASVYRTEWWAED